MISWPVPRSSSLPLPHSTSLTFLIGVFIGISLSFSSSSFVDYLRRKRDAAYHREYIENRVRQPIKLKGEEVIRDGVAGLIGNTPLIRIKSLSDALGVNILGKAEFLNPGGSVKDRVALRVIEDAERQGFLYPDTGSCIFEGTVGSTGISLAMMARARGYNTSIIMPDDVAKEKVMALEAMGAKVEKVRPASIVDKKQFVNMAKQRALEYGSATGCSVITPKDALVIIPEPRQESLAEAVNLGGPCLDTESKLQPRGFFADQFESRSNYDAHFHGTGPEIWQQTNGRLHAFVSGAGTGGTIAGVGQYLKAMDEDVLVALADPEGSGLYNKVKHGVMFDFKESEGTKRRHQVDTVVEGIGLNRLTNNFELALPIIDDAFRTTDIEAVAMSRHLVLNDGLFLGSSSACNLVACVRLAKKMGWKDGQSIVTVLCDSGSRHYSKFWNNEYLRASDIPSDPTLITRMINGDC